MILTHQILIWRLHVFFVGVQDDKYSHDVTQQLLVVVVPFWLKTNKDPTTLLQVNIYCATPVFVYIYVFKEGPSSNGLNSVCIWLTCDLDVLTIVSF